MSSTQTLTQRKTTKDTTSSSSATPSTTTQKSFLGPDGSLISVNRVPSSKPSFTIGDIRSAIPSHCFSRPLTKSFGYVFWDLFLIGVIYYASTFIPVVASDALFGSTFGPVLRHALWIVYWICQGCVMTGLWVIGHECGHRGFADSDLINDAVGLVLHSFLLVPYFSWQISHRRHHSNTGSVEHDEVFVPSLATPEEVAKHKQRMEHHEEEGFIKSTTDTLQRMFTMTVMFTLGWPSYLAMNVTGNQSYDPKKWVNHFVPQSPIFTNGSASDIANQKLIIISDVALFAVMAIMYKFIQITSLSHYIYVYFIPYLITNFFLVLITYLQHTDLNLPHYTDGEWDWLRGALATIDRDYGILNVVFHHITDTHVVHHLFSFMPHYHAEEATRAVIPLLGEYYRFDKTPVHKALWNSYRDCNRLYPDEANKGVHWFEPK